MLVDEVQVLLDRYAKWLRDKTTLKQVKDWVEITTPFVDRHNDFLQIYAKKENGHYILTDDGYILDDLVGSGCSLDTPKRKTLLNITLNGFGIKLRDNRLEIQATNDDFTNKKHNLLQAMIAVNDMFYTASPTVASLFAEDVIAWLDLKEIRYTQNIKFTGTSGYDHVFDFVIPKSRKSPERIARAISDPNRQTAQMFLFSWNDIRDVRPSDAKAFTFLNDSKGENKIPRNVLDALQSYNVTPVPWSEREKHTSVLAA